VLGHTNEGHLVLLERFHQLGEVEQGATEPVNPMGQDAVDLPGLDVGQ